MIFCFPAMIVIDCLPSSGCLRYTQRYDILHLLWQKRLDKHNTSLR